MFVCKKRRQLVGSADLTQTVRLTILKVVKVMTSLV